MKKLFTRFCKENDIYEIVIRNKKIENCIKNLRSDGSILSIFDTSIAWMGTEQGFSFWYEIHMKWCIFLAQNGAIEKKLIKEFKYCRMTKECSDMYMHYRDIFNSL